MIAYDISNWYVQCVFAPCGVRCVMMDGVCSGCSYAHGGMMGGGELVRASSCLRAMYDVRALHVVREFHMAVQYGEHGAYVQCVRCVR